MNDVIERYAEKAHKAGLDVLSRDLGGLSHNSLEGGYGREYNLGVEIGTCDITGEHGPCLWFDSSDGEYTSLSISLELVHRIYEVERDILLDKETT